MDFCFLYWKIIIFHKKKPFGVLSNFQEHKWVLRSSSLRSTGLDGAHGLWKRLSILWIRESSPLGRGVMTVYWALLCQEVLVGMICCLSSSMALGKLLSLWALLFSFVTTWAWGLGVGGKIMCWISSGSKVFTLNSWNLLFMLALFAPLKEIGENWNSERRFQGKHEA